MNAGAATADPSSDPWAAFRKSIQLYLDAVAVRPDVQRITLVDGPAVLGWPQWRKLEEAFSLGALKIVLDSAIDVGSIRKRSTEPLAHLIFGSVMEAALVIANAEDPVQRRAEIGEALDDLLCGLV